MDVGLSSLRSEAVGAMRTALVSAENLQLSLKSELSQEEQALTLTKSSPQETHKDGYCTIRHGALVMEVYLCFFLLSFISGYCFLRMLVSWKPTCSVNRTYVNLLSQVRTMSLLVIY